MAVDRYHPLYQKSFEERFQTGSIWNDLRLAWSGSDLIYVGKHMSHKAATSDAEWFVWKLTWTSGDLTRSEGPLVGDWDSCASLGWA